MKIGDYDFEHFVLKEISCSLENLINCFVNLFHLLLFVMDILLKYLNLQKASKYDQEIPLSQSKDQPTAPRGRDTVH